jgi:hypothetical protein
VEATMKIRTKVKAGAEGLFVEAPGVVEADIDIYFKGNIDMDV